jgi:hypothetical protein
MKLLPRLILACATIATCTVAGAQAYDSAADQDRRARNREEALARYHASQDGTRPTSRASQRSESAGGPTLGDRSRKAAKSVRNFTHRQADKARRFSERQDRKWGPAKSTSRSKTAGTPD